MVMSGRLELPTCFINYVMWYTVFYHEVIFHLWNLHTKHVSVWCGKRITAEQKSPQNGMWHLHDTSSFAFFFFAFWSYWSEIKCLWGSIYVPGVLKNKSTQTWSSVAFQWWKHSEFKPKKSVVIRGFFDFFFFLSFLLSKKGTQTHCAITTVSCYVSRTHSHLTLQKNTRQENKQWVC